MGGQVSVSQYWLISGGGWRRGSNFQIYETVRLARVPARLSRAEVELRWIFLRWRKMERDSKISNIFWPISWRKNFVGLRCERIIFQEDENFESIIVIEEKKKYIFLFEVL